MLTTAAIYTMIIEAGLGLCAINLPTVYGFMANKGAQTLIDGFQSIFSIRSISREEISSPPHSENKLGRLHSSGSESDSQHILRKQSTEPKRSEKSNESYAMMPSRGIRVTQEIDVAGRVV